MGFMVLYNAPLNLQQHNLIAYNSLDAHILSDY